MGKKRVGVGCLGREKGNHNKKINEKEQKRGKEVWLKGKQESREKEKQRRGERERRREWERDA